MYVSIQEAVVNHLLFELFEETNTVKKSSVSKNAWSKLEYQDINWKK